MNDTKIQVKKSYPNTNIIRVILEDYTNSIGNGYHERKYNKLFKNLFRSAIENSTIKLESEKNIEILSQRIKEVKANYMLASYLCEQVEHKYGREIANWTKILFTSAICEKDGSVLLIYDKGGDSESIIVRDKKTGNIAFISRIEYKDKKINYYAESDYFEMNNIRKFDTEGSILSVLHQPAYEKTDEYWEEFKASAEKGSELEAKLNRTQVSHNIRTIEYGA